MWETVKDKANKVRMAEVKGERKKKFRKLIIEKKIEIARIVEEKQNEEEYLIEIRTVEEMVPRRFHKYLKVFEKRELERMLTRKTWDHAIDPREDFILKKENIYLLSRIEKKEVQEFVKDQLKKGYIQLSKSLQMSLIFFVLKKDEKKRMVQGYRYLNSWTIKNNYLLSLISDLINNIEKKKFIKMNLRWGYNNVRIKEEDK